MNLQSRALNPPNISSHQWVGGIVQIARHSLRFILCDFFAGDNQTFCGFCLSLWTFDSINLVVDHDRVHLHCPVPYAESQSYRLRSTNSLMHNYDLSIFLNMVGDRMDPRSGVSNGNCTWICLLDLMQEPSLSSQSIWGRYECSLSLLHTPALLLVWESGIELPKEYHERVVQPQHNRSKINGPRDSLASTWYYPLCK